MSDARDTLFAPNVQQSYMRIQSTPERDRRFEKLKQATGESTKSGAIDVAASYYITMAGTQYDESAVEELLTAARDNGSLTAGEIAEIIDQPELHASVRTTIDIGMDID